MKIGLPKARQAGENRVALIPENVQRLTERGIDIVVERGAGSSAGFSDEAYQQAGAELVGSAGACCASADIVVAVNLAGEALTETASLLDEGQLLLGMMDPLSDQERFTALAQQGITSVALELVPRISRAQSMDVLSSMATLAGYKAVLLAANASKRIYPMMMTAAGNLSPARVFIMGAGVAGLQAAATAKRMGAVVEAYDVRPAAREQILSVGAKPVELELEAEATEGQGGYARQQSEAFLQRQREQMTNILAEQDIVITTAAVPGAKSPVLITADMLAQMKPGAVIVDLASERGGNCELTCHGETRVVNEVTLIGPDNIASTLANHASQMFANNIENFLNNILNEEGGYQLDFDDEIIQASVITHQGELVNSRIRDQLGLSPLLNEPVMEEVA
ncbi:Re/Si-specific NAD(P)(+) transhydrogenase subunit alpha [Neptuniibacter halophilus]|uniref:Re/Si-specific NAD(P)(+) transhydrogenase subunit alpha n=1 Tax=Neptuniibacter halophilus TaxID=651666 RepID=UPI002574825D|nr:Re/Si-specific NAD(P)(+) transhydrogenase subunit alpha [Neptuniibacter halophilus]